MEALARPFSPTNQQALLEKPRWPEEPILETSPPSLVSASIEQNHQNVSWYQLADCDESHPVEISDSNYFPGTVSDVMTEEREHAWSWDTVLIHQIVFSGDPYPFLLRHCC